MGLRLYLCAASIWGFYGVKFLGKPLIGKL